MSLQCGPWRLDFRRLAGRLMGAFPEDKKAFSWGQSVSSFVPASVSEGFGVCFIPLFWCCLAMVWRSLLDCVCIYHFGVAEAFLCRRFGCARVVALLFSSLGCVVDFALTPADRRGGQGVRGASALTDATQSDVTEQDRTPIYLQEDLYCNVLLHKTLFSGVERNPVPWYSDTRPLKRW